MKIELIAIKKIILKYTKVALDALDKFGSKKFQTPKKGCAL